MTRPQCNLAELRRLDVDHHLPAHQDYKLMRDIGFHPTEEVAGWVWRGRERRRPSRGPQKESHAFAALAALKR